MTPDLLIILSVIGILSGLVPSIADFHEAQDQLDMAENYEEYEKHAGRLSTYASLYAALAVVGVMIIVRTK